MDQARQSELRHRLVEQLASGVDPMADERWHYPTAPYHDPAHLERERRLLERVPVVVGQASQVARPGDFTTHDLSGRPLLLARDDHGTLRGFHNVCRHRGARVETEPCGHQRRFTCPYHAWSYDLEGRLRGIPDAEGFAGLDRDARGLVPVAVAERHGLLWADLSADPARPLDVAGYLGELDDELSSYALDGYRAQRHAERHEAFNWKLVIDGFLETYHLRFLHADTIGPHIRSNFALADPYGPHTRMVVLRSSFDRVVQDPAEPLMGHLVIIYQVFPNTVLAWQADHFEAWTAWPGTDVASSSAEATLMAPRDRTGDDDQLHWDKNWKILMDTVTCEDFPASRSIQEGYRSGAQHDVVFGRQEAALQHYHRQLDRWTASPSDPAEP